MTFIKRSVLLANRPNRYEGLGYRANPFPTQGEFREDIFVERSELDALRTDLSKFLEGRPNGSVWALSGIQGVGKSNFLHYVAAELRDMEGWGDLTRTAYRLLPSIALSPARVAEELVDAIGFDRIQRLAEVPRDVPKAYRSTDFERFWITAFRPETDAASRAKFLVTWLAGHQTIKAERERYGLLARERLPPSVAFPYLRALVDMLQTAKLLDRIILLLDEFEDVQLLRRAERTEYVQTLKTLLNAFNWKGLFVIIAGAPMAFTAIAESHPSLSSRLGRVAELSPLGDADAAVKLANAYKERARLGDNRPEDLPPSDLEIQKSFIQLFNAKPSRIVTQRDLLTNLHEYIERRIGEGGAGPGPGFSGGAGFPSGRGFRRDTRAR